MIVGCAFHGDEYHCNEDFCVNYSDCDYRLLMVTEMKDETDAKYPTPEDDFQCPVCQTKLFRGECKVCHRNTLIDENGACCGCIDREEVRADV